MSAPTIKGNKTQNLDYKNNFVFLIKKKIGFVCSTLNIKLVMAKALEKLKVNYKFVIVALFTFL